MEALEDILKTLRPEYAELGIEETEVGTLEIILSDLPFLSEYSHPIPFDEVFEAIRDLALKMFRRLKMPYKISCRSLQSPINHKVTCMMQPYPRILVPTAYDMLEYAGLDFSLTYKGKEKE